jgi:hypothetical protein
MIRECFAKIHIYIYIYIGYKTSIKKSVDVLCFTEKFLSNGVCCLR